MPEALIVLIAASVLIKTEAVAVLTLNGEYRKAEYGA